MPMLATPHGTLHYLDEGQGEPLLLLHANPGDSRDFAAVVPALARHHRVLALDWPGFGQSRRPAGSAPGSLTVLDLYAALQAFICGLALPPVWIVGNSVGGNAAARLAAEHPERVRGLVLVAPGGFTPHNALTRGFCHLQGSALALSPRVFAGLYLKRRTPVTQAMLARAAGEQATPARRALGRALWRSFARPENDLRGLASHIKAPTLLVFGEQDPAIPPARDGGEARRCLPHARFVTLPCGHAAFAEVPESFLGEVTAFIDQSSPPGWRSGLPGRS